jgi:hypothetical protein
VPKRKNEVNNNIKKTSKNNTKKQIIKNKFNAKNRLSALLSTKFYPKLKKNHNVFSKERDKVLSKSGISQWTKNRQHWNSVASEKVQKLRI